MVRVARWTARFCAMAVALVGALALMGWAGNRPMLKGMIIDGVAMNPVTAIGFIFCALALLVLCGIEAGPGWRSRQLAQLFTFVVVMIGAQRLIAYALNWPWALD